MYDRISFMLRIEDVAAAQATLTADKTYYSFATTDSAEEGELATVSEDFEGYCTRLLNCFNAGVATPQPIEPVSFKLFVNNRAMTPVILSPDTLREFVDMLSSAHQEFAFLNGFIGACKS